PVGVAVVVLVVELEFVGVLDVVVEFASSLRPDVSVGSSPVYGVVEAVPFLPVNAVIAITAAEMPITNIAPTMIANGSKFSGFGAGAGGGAATGAGAGAV